jgi:hypothetical protein
MDVSRSIGARQRNRCCYGKAISITYSECVFVALVIQHGKRMHRLVICRLYGSTIVFRHYLINGKISGKNVIEHKMCVDSVNNIVLNVSHFKKNSARCRNCS